MTTRILPCANCLTSTIHRTPASDRDANGAQSESLKCEVCGTVRAVSAGDEGEAAALALETARLINMIPAMSQKRAHSRLEEILFEYRSAIEGSDAFQRAVSDISGANACDFEIQDIKVQKHHWEPALMIINFSYFALRHGGAAQASGAMRIEGAAIGQINDRGDIAIQNVTAAMAAT